MVTDVFDFQRIFTTICWNYLKTVESKFSFSILSLHGEHSTNSPSLSSVAASRILQFRQRKNLVTSTATIQPVTSCVSFSFGFSCSEAAELSTDKLISSHMVTTQSFVPFKHFLLKKPTFKLDHSYDFWSQT